MLMVSAREPEARGNRPRGDDIMHDSGSRTVARILDSWSDERANTLRSSAADIKNRAAALGQWRAAFESSYINWTPSRTA